MNTPRSIAEALIAKWRERAERISDSAGSMLRDGACSAEGEATALCDAADELQAAFDALATANGAEVGLPELPEPKGWMNLHDQSRVQQAYGYTVNQMNAHGQACFDAGYARAYADLCSRGEDRRDAARFRALQDMPPEKAQAFFWNYSSRKQRAKALDAAIAGEGGDHA